MMVRIRAVAPLADFRVHLSFTDGTERVVDLAPYLHGPVFEPLRRNREVFASVRVDEQLGTIVWPNGADVDPDALYWGREPAAWSEPATPGAHER